jgi:hypothetical protein
MSRAKKGTGSGGENINTFSAMPERASATPCMQRNKQPGTFSLHEAEGTQESTRNKSLVITIRRKRSFAKPEQNRVENTEWALHQHCLRSPQFQKAAKGMGHEIKE